MNKKNESPRLKVKHPFSGKPFCGSRGGSYAEKLEDPRWKSRRMDILVRDKGRCVKCLSPHWLQVHHKEYITGLEPWEYPDELLETLCRRCHPLEGGHFYCADFRHIKDIIPVIMKRLKAGIVYE